MQSIHLSASRAELIGVLDTASCLRRRRFSSVLPIWVSFSPDRGEIEIREDRGVVLASLPATGNWPPAGATVDLFMLRGALKSSHDPVVRLHAVQNGVLIETPRGNVKLNLLEFGPEVKMGSAVKRMNLISDLPLFRPLFDRRKR